jgi:hypothetical protein
MAAGTGPVAMLRDGGFRRLVGMRNAMRLREVWTPLFLSGELCEIPPNHAR